MSNNKILLMFILSGIPTHITGSQRGESSKRSISRKSINHALGGMLKKVFSADSEPAEQPVTRILLQTAAKEKNPAMRKHDSARGPLEGIQILATNAGIEFIDRLHNAHNTYQSVVTAEELEQIQGLRLEADEFDRRTMTHNLDLLRGPFQTGQEAKEEHQSIETLKNDIETRWYTLRDILELRLREQRQTESSRARTSLEISPPVSPMLSPSLSSGDSVRERIAKIDAMVQLEQQAKKQQAPIHSTARKSLTLSMSKSRSLESSSSRTAIAPSPQAICPA